MPLNDRDPGLADLWHGDPQIDSQMAGASALQTTNAAAADRAWRRIDKEIMAQVPWVPLVNPVGIDVLSPTVGNYQRTAT